ncbi:hypothetical protein AGMMS50262_01160 [Bacteroidia bacterium]|nr:hypothetical protein AGMMS50262_01160 [Bacteroidia bacterium]
MAQNLTVKKYQCINFGNCAKADAKEVIEVNSGDEPVCPEPGCESRLIEIPPKKFPLKLVLIIAGIVIVLGGCFMVYRSVQKKAEIATDSVCLVKKIIDTVVSGDTTGTAGETKQEIKHPITSDSISLDKTTLSFEKAGETAQLTATVLPDNADDKTVVWQSINNAVATVSETGLVTAVAVGNAEITAYTGNGFSATCKVTVKKDEPEKICSKCGNKLSKCTCLQPIPYSCGKYVGSLKNGIPEGDGTMTYTSRVQIAKHDTQNPPHYAEAGDKFVGSWGNGDIVSGTLYDKNGAIKERIFAPKRFNPYDISKDCN